MGEPADGFLAVRNGKHTPSGHDWVADRGGLVGIPRLGPARPPVDLHVNAIESHTSASSVKVKLVPASTSLCRRADRLPASQGRLRARLSLAQQQQAPIYCEAWESCHVQAFQRPGTWVHVWRRSSPGNAAWYFVCGCFAQPCLMQ